MLLDQFGAAAVDAPYWSDRPVYLIGGGESARCFDLEKLRGEYVVVCNDSALCLPWATAVITCDMKWQEERRPLLETFKGERYVVAYTDIEYDPVPGVRYVQAERKPGLSSNPWRIRPGGNTGYCALGLAFLKRARHIVLIGYDLDPETPGHWHGGYPWNAGGNERYFPGWARNMEDAALACQLAGVYVENANPNSGIRIFPFNPDAAPRLK